MQVEKWELSQSFTFDSQGIRTACVVQQQQQQQQQQALQQSKDCDQEMQQLVDVDSFRVLIGNQSGGMCEFGVPSGGIYPILYQHNHAIVSMIENKNHGVFVTGCKDGMVRVFSSASSHELIRTLQGHEKPVTSMSWGYTTNTNNTAEDHTPFLITGSWDQTAKVWNIQTGAMIATLPGHENSVCVVGLPTPTTPTTPSNDVLRIATGSAGIAQNNQISNHTIRIWSVHTPTGQATCLHTVANDHEGPIRSITTISSNSILASCSNDGTVKLRSTQTGQCFSTLTFLQSHQSHPPMLLSVAPVDNDTALVATAEDGHVVVWDQASENQTTTTTTTTSTADDGPQLLLHPACVWNVLPLPNGDFATCCDDGMLRIFTRSTERIAPEQERQQFAQAVQEAHAKQSTGPSPEEISKLRKWETSSTSPGTSEGQVQVFNKNGVAIAAQWSMVSQTWIEVGQVMGSNDGGMIDGVQYDHVLPIEVDQSGGAGVANLQIGYNNGENPFVAAQRFIDQHVLPQYHLNDIANYIQQRVGTQTPTLGGIATSASAGTGTTSSNAATTPVATTGIPMISYQHLPMQTYKSFDLTTKTATTTLEKMKTKLIEFGKLSDSQLGNVSSLMETLAATNQYHSTKIPSTELDVIWDMLQQFPPVQVFPALDLARMTILHPNASSSSNVMYWTKVLTQAAVLCEPSTIVGLEGPAAVAIPMLSLRLFANAFRGGPGSLQAATELLDSILTCAQSLVSSKNKNIRLSVATVLYNVSFYLHLTKTTPRPHVASQVVTIVNSILDLAKLYETEALTRSLISLGTVSMTSPEAKQVAKTLYVVSKVEMAASPHGDTAKAIAKEVYHVLA